MCHEPQVSCGMASGLSRVQTLDVESLMAQAPVVVISGAATGLGRRIAERFEAGRDVVDVHTSNIVEGAKDVNDISGNIE